MHYSHLETFLRKLDEHSRKKLQDLYLTYVETMNDLSILPEIVDNLSAKIMKIDDEISRYKTEGFQNKQILENLERIRCSIPVSQNDEQNFYFEAQKKFKNKSVNKQLLFSQNLMEAKNECSRKNEIVTVEVEMASMEWEYSEINKIFADPQAIYFELSKDNLSFEKNMKEIIEYLNKK